MALNMGVVGAKPCNHKNCMTCPAISDLPVHRIIERNVRPHSGTCVTYNTIYAYIAPYIVPSITSVGLCKLCVRGLVNTGASFITSWSGTQV